MKQTAEKVMKTDYLMVKNLSAILFLPVVPLLEFNGVAPVCLNEDFDPSCLKIGFNLIRFPQY